MAWIMTEQKLKGARYSENSNQATLWQFKKVIETGDLRYLLILKSYKELPESDLQVLTIVWQRIYQEFSDIAGGNRADLWLVKVKRLTTMKLDYSRHIILLRMVEQYPVQMLIDEAKEEGYTIDADNFKQTFEKAYTRLMKLKNQIGIEENNQEKNEADEQSIDNLITKLSRFQGYQFNEKKMSVSQFANIYKDYKDAQANKE